MRKSLHLNPTSLYTSCFFDVGSWSTWNELWLHAQYDGGSGATAAADGSAAVVCDVHLVAPGI